MGKIKLSEDDLKTIKNIAVKYNITVSELGKLLNNSKFNPREYRKQVLFTAEELKTIDDRAKKQNMKRNAYMNMCLLQGIRNNFQGVSIVNILSDKKIREERIVYEASNAEVYDKIMEINARYGIPFSTFVRYISLNTRLDDIAL